MVKAPAPPYVGPPKHHGSATNKPIRRITIHSLVSGTGPGTAKQFASYFRTTTRMASCHYIVDPTTTVQLGHDSLVCFHAPPNSGSIGIEMADNPGTSEAHPASVSRWNTGNHAATLARCAKLVAQLCLAYEVPIKRLSSSQLRAGQHGISAHVDVSYAWHQTSHWDCGSFPWSKFIRMVKKEAKALQGKGTGVTIPSGGTSGSAVSGVLNKGDRGAAVQAMQKMLGVDDDGVFGDVTLAALIAFQDAAGLDPDGAYGPKTKKALTKHSKEKERGLLMSAWPTKTYHGKQTIKADGKYHPVRIGTTKKGKAAYTYCKPNGAKSLFEFAVFAAEGIKTGGSLQVRAYVVDYKAGKDGSNKVVASYGMKEIGGTTGKDWDDAWWLRVPPKAPKGHDYRLRFKAKALGKDVTLHGAGVYSANAK